MNPFTRRSRDSVAGLGEVALIGAIKRWLGDVNPPSPAGIGDDCAVLPAARIQQVITTDPVVFGKHFDASIAPSDVGAKLLKRNLSDIASMGAKPTAAVVALVMDGTVKREWLQQFYQGLAAVARKFGVKVVGGDVAQAPRTLTACLTLVGEATTRRILTRTGARAGDWIYVTGQLGGSILGHHYRFSPRLPEGQWLAKNREVRSMMDVSDGLGKDLPALAPIGGAWPALSASAIPISPAAHTLAGRSGRTALDHALNDGEDYELVFTLAQQADRLAFEKAWRRRFKTKLSCIGFLATAKTKMKHAIPLKTYRGYEHFR